MEQLDYLLTIRIPIKAVDSIDARMKGKEFVKKIGFKELSESGASLKFQLIHKDKAPSGVDLLLDKQE